MTPCNRRFRQGATDVDVACCIFEVAGAFLPAPAAHTLALVAGDADFKPALRSVLVGRPSLRAVVVAERRLLSRPYYEWLLSGGGDESGLALSHLPLDLVLGTGALSHPHPSAALVPRHTCKLPPPLPLASRLPRRLHDGRHGGHAKGAPRGAHHGAHAALPNARSRAVRSRPPRRRPSRRRGVRSSGRHRRGTRVRGGRGGAKRGRRR